MKTNFNKIDKRKSGLLSHPEQRGSVYDIVTERIVALLEKGTVPWHKPWKEKGGMPKNLISKKPYRGINAFLLHSMLYESPFWLTFNQCRGLGGQVRRGEKSTPVVFWKMFEVTIKENDDKKVIPLLRFYNVFNENQCEGLKPEREVLSETVMAPQTVIESMPLPPDIRYGMRQAAYSQAEDAVLMPDRSSFESADAFYSTLFHELVHSTGHSKRLDRKSLTESGGFGSDPYSREELVAEMGAAFLCGATGIGQSYIQNSAAYVKHWLEHLRNDNKLLIQASAQGQKAVDFILRSDEKLNSEGTS